jgi:carbonic anhydrase/acetyltransferase-like protein (isoleucine patch superfamily)
MTCSPESPQPQAVPRQWHGSWTNIRRNPAGDQPCIHPTAYIDPSAMVIGNVRIGPRVFVGPYAVIRADEPGPSGDVAPIDIAAECNIQDGVFVHALGGSRVLVGPRTSLSHGCIVHGPCRVGAECFIGFRAVAFDAVLDEGVFVGAGGVLQGVDVQAGAFVAPGRTVLSADDAAALPKADPTHREFVAKVVAANLRLLDGYVGRSTREAP